MIKNAILVVGVVVMGLAPAWAWGERLEEFVAGLNTPQAQEELGIKEATRPEGSVNRLEVVFEAEVPVSTRAKGLQALGNKFLAVLFEETGIATATVVERTTAGDIRQLNVVNVTGSSTSPAELRLLAQPGC